MASKRQHAMSGEPASTRKPEPKSASHFNHAAVQTFERNRIDASQLSASQAKMHELFGQVALAVLNTPRYRHLPMQELTQLVLDPLLKRRIAFAHGVPASSPSQMETAGFAFWASVSPNVDAKLNEQVRAGTFPVRLQPEDWASGDIHWLLDIIAPNPQVASQMLINFKQVAKENMVKFHPVLGSLVDKDMLRKVIAAAAPGPSPMAAVN